MIVRDLTGPPSYVLRPRRLAEIRAEVAHQTGFERRWNSPRWSLVAAHFIVHQCGRVTQLHPITARMRVGCGPFNAHAINVEHEGNYPLDYRDGEPLYWAPDKFGRSVLAEHPEQVQSARELAAFLAEQVAGLAIGAHRQLELEKSGCCGPDLWREVGQWAVDELGIPEMPVAGGRPIPDAWRCSVAAPTDRAYTVPLEVPL